MVYEWGGSRDPFLRCDNSLEQLTERGRHFAYVFWVVLKETTQERANGRDAQGTAHVLADSEGL